MLETPSRAFEDGRGFEPLIFCDIICSKIQLSRQPMRAAYPSRVAHRRGLKM